MKTGGIVTESAGGVEGLTSHPPLLEERRSSFRKIRLLKDLVEQDFKKKE